MSDDPRSITYIGSSDFRNQNIKFGIRAKDRLRHTYIVGATGVGKSTLIENLIIQDIQNGNGVAMFDPHGSSAEKILDYIPEHRLKDVIYFAPFDLEFPIAFNPLEDPGPDFRYQVSDSLLSAFKKIWPDAFSARMEYILSMTLLALLEYPGSTLLAVNRMLSEKQFRIDVVNHVTDPSVKAFWVDEFMKWDEKYAREASAAIQNKVGQFTSNPLIRNILGQPVSSVNFRDMLDKKKIFIANLSKGRVGEQNAPLLGAMLITKLYLAAMSRADMSESEMHKLPPLYMYVDEFQNFANDSFENILSESRKYKLGLTIAHQYIEQMPENIQAAVFGNVGTKIVFRTQKAEDAELFEKAFAPTFVQTDFMNLGMAQVYITLMIDGVGSAPFSARTLPPIAKPQIPIREQVLASSRSLYAHPRSEVEAQIAAWYMPKQGMSLQAIGGGSQPEKPPRELNDEEKKKRDEYYAAKKAEIEARGGVWVSPEEHKKIKEAKLKALESGIAEPPIIQFPYNPPKELVLEAKPVIDQQKADIQKQAPIVVDPEKASLPVQSANIDSARSVSVPVQKDVRPAPYSGNSPRTNQQYQQQERQQDRKQGNPEKKQEYIKKDTTAPIQQRDARPVQQAKDESQKKESKPIEPRQEASRSPRDIGQSVAVKDTAPAWIDLSNIQDDEKRGAVQALPLQSQQPIPPEPVKREGQQDRPVVHSNPAPVLQPESKDVAGITIPEQSKKEGLYQSKVASSGTANALRDAIERAREVAQQNQVIPKKEIEASQPLTNAVPRAVYTDNEQVLKEPEAKATVSSKEAPVSSSASGQTALAPQPTSAWAEIPPSQLAKILGSDWK
jgi:hypothetical protein